MFNTEKKRYRFVLWEMEDLMWTKPYTELSGTVRVKGSGQYKGEDHTVELTMKMDSDRSLLVEGVWGGHKVFSHMVDGKFEKIEAERRNVPHMYAILANIEEERHDSKFDMDVIESILIPNIIKEREKDKMFRRLSDIPVHESGFER